jgi:hypothetical protein
MEADKNKGVLRCIGLQGTTPAISSIWKSRAPPKCKFSAWLISQDRVWSADRLAARGWPHNDSCVLCRHQLESTHQLWVDGRYTKCIWELVAAWTTTSGLNLANWQLTHDTLQWWTMITTVSDTPRRALRCISLLIVWEIWKERNTRTFDRRESSTVMLIAKIRGEAST